MSFGEYLQRLIKAKGYSYRKVALLSGVDHTYISRLVRNKKERPSPEILAKLAPPLGTTYEDLMSAAGYLQKKTCEMTKTSQQEGHVISPSEEVLEMSIIPQINDPTAPPPFYVRDGNGRYVTIPKKFLVDGDFLWCVKGTSLPEAGIEEGDYVVIKRQPVAKVGEIILTQNGQELSLKKVKNYNDLLVHQGEGTSSSLVRNIGIVVSSHRLHIKGNGKRNGSPE